MSAELTSAQVRNLLWDKLKPRIGRPRTQKELAAEIGVSTPFLNDILNGNREPSGKPLKFLGLERVVTYRFRKRPRKRRSPKPSGDT